MKNRRCPACRRRFSANSEFAECSRCGADLSLLITLRKHADRLVSAALAAPFIETDERIRRLKKAQAICHTPEIQQLIDSMCVEKALMA